MATPTANLRFSHRLVGHLRVGNVGRTCVALRYKLNGFRRVRIRSLAGRGVSSRRVVVSGRTYRLIGGAGLRNRHMYTVNADIVGTARATMNASKVVGRFSK